MSRQLVCLALLACVATAAAALPKYSCSGKITDPTSGKKLAFVEWTATLLNSDGKKAGTFKLCWNRQGIQYPPPVNATAPANVTNPPEFQWAAVLTNVEAYYSLNLGAPTTNLTLPVGVLTGPPPTLVKKADFFGTVPKALLTNPILAQFFAAGCTVGDKGTTSAQIAITTLNLATGATVPGTKVFFKLAKGGACTPNIYP